MTTERPLYASWSPTFKVDGSPKVDLAGDHVHLEVEETTEGLRTCVARFLNIGPRSGAAAEGFLYLDGRTLDFGKRLEVSVGPVGGERVVFNGVVSALEHRYAEGEAHELAVFAEDALMKLRMTRRSRTYENVSDADIARDVASEHGLRPDCDAPGPTYDLVQQWDQSDLAFLRERARLVQAELFADDDRLCFKARGARSGTEVTLVVGNTLLRASVRADLAHQRTKVRISGYDAKARAVIEEEAGPDAVRGEVESGRTGPEILERALGERVGHRAREAPLTTGEAAAWARAEMLRRARGFVHLDATTSGTPELVVGSKIEIQGMGGPFDGARYHVTRVCHTYERRSGLRTHFDAERATVSDP
jgi:phage protein D